MVKLSDSSYESGVKIGKLKDTLKAFGTALLISVAIATLEHAIKKTAEAFRESVTTISDWKDQAKTARGEWNSTSDKITETKNRMEQLREQMDRVRAGEIVDPDEISKIQTENDELATQLKLLREIATEEGKKANKAAAEALNGTQYKSNYKTQEVDVIAPINTETGTYNYASKETVAANITANEYLEEQIRLYSELTAEKRNYDFQLRNGTIFSAEYNEVVGALDEKLQTTKDEILETSNAIETMGASAVNDGSAQYAEIAEKVDRAREAYSNFIDEYSNVEVATQRTVEEVGYIAQSFEDLNSAIDSIQSAYKDLTSAVEEYNQHGYLSMDTLQSLIDMDDAYLASLSMENGQLSVNMNYMQALAEARLNDAKATAIQQAMSELDAIANNSESTAAAGAMSTLSAKGAVVDYLAGRYANLGDWAGYAYQQQALADSYAGAAAVNQAAATKVMTGLNTKLGLIDSTMKAVQGSARGAANALGGFSSASGGAAGGANKLTDALNKQKEALKDIQDQLKKEENRLKIYGQVAIKAIDKQVKALEEKKKALQDANDEEDRALKLAELEEALARAQKSRNVRTYTDDKGFVWMADQAEVDDAQNALDDQKRDWGREDAVAAIDAEIEKLNDLKDMYNETMGLIGTSWEDYQTMLEAQALFEGMTYDQMANYHTEYKDSVLENMRQLFEIEQQMQDLDNQIAEAGNGSGGGGGGGGGGPKIQADALQDLIEKIKECGKENRVLTDELDKMNIKLADIQPNTAQYAQAMSGIISKNNEVSGNLGELGVLMDEFSQKLIDNSNLSQAERDEEMASIANMLAEYGVTYDTIRGYLDDYLEKVQSTYGEASEQYQNAVADIGGVEAALNDSVGPLAEYFEAIKQTEEDIVKLREREAELEEQLAGTTEGTAAHLYAMDELNSVQEKLANKTSELGKYTDDYRTAVENQVGVTDEQKQKQLDVLTAFLEYCDAIIPATQATNDNKQATEDATTAEQTFADTIGTIAGPAIEQMGEMGTAGADAGSAISNGFLTAATDAESAVARITAAATAAQNALKKVSGASGIMSLPFFHSGTPRFYASGTVRAYASGTSRVNAVVDDGGREIVVRPRTGRYTTLEVGDGVIRNNWTNTLLSAALNPNKMISDRVEEYFKTHPMALSGATGGQTISVNVGGITMNEVNDLDTFSRVIERSVGTVFAQAVSRNI